MCPVGLSRRLATRHSVRVQAESDPRKIVREFSEETGKTIECAKDYVKEVWHLSTPWLLVDVLSVSNLPLCLLFR